MPYESDFRRSRSRNRRSRSRHRSRSKERREKKPSGSKAVAEGSDPTTDVCILLNVNEKKSVESNLGQLQICNPHFPSQENQ